MGENDYIKCMTITYFGYGSLVNNATLPEHTEITPGRLDGWVREWRIWGTNQVGRGVCSLSVAPEAGTVIRGVAAVEPKAGLEKLEQREHKYHRVHGVGEAFRCDEKGEPGREDMFLFRSKPEHYGWGDKDHPILQSYLDCVLAGFHASWGEAGVSHFLETTRGWHIPVLADRDQPFYPRAVDLETKLAEMIDDHLSDLKVRFLPVT